MGSFSLVTLLFLLLIAWPFVTVESSALATIPLFRIWYKKLNLEGKIVVPGFIDSHVHLIFSGLQMACVELGGVNQKDEVVRRVTEAALNAKRGSWILGGGWNNDLWGGELPVASWIDEVTYDNPVWLTRMDGHMGLANSVALKLAGVTNLYNKN